MSEISIIRVYLHPFLIIDQFDRQLCVSHFRYVINVMARSNLGFDSQSLTCCECLPVSWCIMYVWHKLLPPTSFFHFNRDTSKEIKRSKIAANKTFSLNPSKIAVFSISEKSRDFFWIL